MTLSRDNEPAAGTWVKDRHGVVSQRNPNGAGWGPGPGFWYLANWQAMWDAHGPLELCGRWGHPLVGSELPKVEEFTYRVRWSYVDQFGVDRRGKSPHLRTDSEITDFVRDTFETVKPDAWWVEKVATLSFHEVR